MSACLCCAARPFNSQAPHEYPNGDSQPHLQVAKQMMAQGKPVNMGDHIPYVICAPDAGSEDSKKTTTSSSGDTAGKAIAKRAKHPQEVAQDANKGVGGDQIDVEWCVRACVRCAAQRGVSSWRVWGGWWGWQWALALRR
jgi:DNA polymerase elongation subunit (family B)